MLLPGNYSMSKRDERGGVLITVLIIATIFAVLAYITLQVSLQSLQTTDTHSGMQSARLAAESGIDYAASRLREDTGLGTGPEPSYLPDYNISIAGDEDFLRTELIDAGITAGRDMGTFPQTTYERTAYNVDYESGVSTYLGESSVIPGDREDAEYNYIDDFTFSEDYPAYEFQPVKNTGDLVVYGVGEVIEPESEITLFSYLRAQYPNIQWTFDWRETGVTEPSRIGPYPYIETEHPYVPNAARAWVVSYQQDPLHPNRNINNIRLMAEPGEVQISPGDVLSIYEWDKDNRIFQYAEDHSNFTNGSNRVFTSTLDSTAIALYLMSDSVPPISGLDYGFRVSGVRYGFDYDDYQIAYETPHPYDSIVPQFGYPDLNIQVVYSPFQAQPATPEFSAQQMRIQFDENFSLDGADSLFLYNASDPAPIAPQIIDNGLNPLPLDGYSMIIDRVDPNLPLGFILVLNRATDFDTDGNPDYGYKIKAIEYVDKYGDWVRDENVPIESPHADFLGPNDVPYNFTAHLPLPLPPVLPYAGYQTVYRPFCPNTDDPSGMGTVDSWSICFVEGVSLNVISGASNDDYIRIATPGIPIPMVAPYDEVYFVEEDSALGGLIYDPLNPPPATDYQYRDVDLLNEPDFQLFLSPLASYATVEFHSDTVDQYENEDNFGYRLAVLAYTTSDGNDDDDTPPTVRTDVNFPSNRDYPAYGDGPLTHAEWWYSDDDTDPEALLVGLHFDRFQYDLDPGDRIEVYDVDGLLIATLTAASIKSGPSLGDPDNPDLPSGGEQGDQGPGAGGPTIPSGEQFDTFVDLDDTFGWVLVPGRTAQVKLVGDGDDNEGYAGFEVDHCAFINGDLDELRNYVEDYAQLAYGRYYDRTSDVMNAFRTLGGPQ
jgi:hypothetical protein